MILFLLLSLGFHFFIVMLSMLTIYQRIKRTKKIKFIKLATRYAPFYLVPALIVELIALQLQAPHSNGRISALLIGHLALFIKHRYFTIE
jgi:hypothetical protein